jgi:HNH endonuclease
MARWISAEIRQTIADRANQLCEYCLIAEADTFYGCQVDHIISLKHGGTSELHNLAYAGALCNRAKGSDIASISTSGELSRFLQVCPAKALIPQKMMARRDSNAPPSA